MWLAVLIMMDERKTKGQLITELRELRQRLFIFEQDQKKLKLSITERKRAENIMHARLRLLKFAESHSLEEFTQATLDESEALTTSSIGFYHLVEADQRTLSLQTWSTNTLQHMCTAEGKGQHYDVAKAGVWVDCVHQRRPVIHNSYDALPHRKGMPPGHAPVVRELVVPIFRANKIVAIIGVGNKPSDYDEWDVEAVSLLGDLSWDIAERKLAEDALRESEEHYRSLFDHMLNGFAYCQMHFEQDQPVDFTYLNVNVAFESLTGLKNVVGKQVSEVIPGIRESDPELLKIYGRVALTGIPERFETYVEPLKMWFSISVYSPKKEHFVAIFDVITERKRAEEELRRAKDELEQRVEERTEELTETVAQLEEEMSEREEAEQQAATLGRLYHLLSRVNEAIVRAQDQEGLFRQACRIMMEEGSFLLCWIGRVDWEAGLVRAAAQYDLGNDYPQNITISLEEVPEGRGPTGVAVRQGRWDVCLDIAADPRMAPWRKQALARGFKSSAAFPLFVGDRVEGVLTLYSGQNSSFNTEEISVLNSLAQDLSFAMESMDREARRRQAEEEIHRLNEELEQRVKERTAELEFANRELEAFSYSVSHDLKAPIRAIEGFSRILMHKYSATLESEILRMLNIIYSNTRRMSQLIDDLLTFSRTSRKKVKQAEINFYAMTTKAFEQLRHLTPERDMQLNIYELPPAIGDPSLIEQVMVNLLANAIKFTRSRKTAVIEVGGRVAEQKTIYYVKDNGVGFDERYADKLFGVFQRLHSYDEYEGSGVGLAIVKSIIQRHGGRVWAEGKVDQGATFYFTLPKNGD
jgi:PAS domain S-box-containing protein